MKKSFRNIVQVITSLKPVGESSSSPTVIPSFVQPSFLGIFWLRKLVREQRITTLLGCAQKDVIDYQGNWVGTFPDKHVFNFSIHLDKVAANTHHLVIANDKTLIDKQLQSTSDDHIQIEVDHLILDFRPEENGKGLTGFVKAGRLFYHMRLRQVEPDTYEGTWNPYMFNNALQSDDVLLSYSEDDWVYKTDPMAREQSTNTPTTLNDGWETQNIVDFEINELELLRLIDNAHANTLINTHSVLIAKQGKLVFENYFKALMPIFPTIYVLHQRASLRQ